MKSDNQETNAISFPYNLTRDQLLQLHEVYTNYIEYPDIAVKSDMIYRSLRDIEPEADADLIQKEVKKMCARFPETFESFLKCMDRIRHNVVREDGKIAGTPEAEESIDEDDALVMCCELYSAARIRPESNRNGVQFLNRSGNLRWSKDNNQSIRAAESASSCSLEKIADESDKRAEKSSKELNEAGQKCEAPKAKVIDAHERVGLEHGLHSISLEEKAAFAEHINNCLEADPDVKHLLPICTKDDGIFTCVSDGVLLCKLINASVPNTIDPRAINQSRRKPLNVYEKTENLNLCINAARSIGCTVVNIGPGDLIAGTPTLVLGLIWQILKLQLTATINLKHHPELVQLLAEEEALDTFIKLPPDCVLLRWMNFHLRQAQYPKLVTNFSADVQDGHAYSTLLHQIAPDICDLCTETILAKRAAHIIRNAQHLRVETFMKPQHIMSGNAKLNMAFVAQIFNMCPALIVKQEEQEAIDEIFVNDVNDTREERTFRMWINSLGLVDFRVNHLYSDVQDGVLLLKLYDRLEKGTVDWRRVYTIAPNTFRCISNCNYAVEIGKDPPFSYSMVNIGGADIISGNKKLILSIIWQCMRYQQLKLLGSLARAGHKVKEKELLNWVNEKLSKGSPDADLVKSFRDSAFADGLVLLKLVHWIENRAVNWNLVRENVQSDEDRLSNAKYLISCSHKIGATAFVTCEDIVEVRPRMILTLVASLMAVELKIST